MSMNYYENDEIADSCPLQVPALDMLQYESMLANLNNTQVSFFVIPTFLGISFEM